MTEEIFDMILNSTMDENGFYYSNRANRIYAERFPDAEFSLFRRVNDKIKIGYSTLILPSFKVKAYFEKIPLRKEGICYTNIGTFEEMRADWKQFLAEMNGE
jgi:hypothetical protein